MIILLEYAQVKYNFLSLIFGIILNFTKKQHNLHRIKSLVWFGNLGMKGQLRELLKQSTLNFFANVLSGFTEVCVKLLNKLNRSYIGQVLSQVTARLSFENID